MASSTESSFSLRKVSYGATAKVSSLPIHVSRPNRKFLKHRPEVELLPAIELQYTLTGVSLMQMLSAFKLMVFDDSDKLTASFEKQRKMQMRQDVTATSSCVRAADGSREEWKFKTVLLPLMEAEKVTEMKEVAIKEEHKTETASASASATDASAAADSSSSYLSGAWTAVSDWSSWAVTGWSETINAWAKMMNMLLVANETWRVCWMQKEAVSIVENETMRSMVAVDEYSQMVQLKDDGSGVPKVLFVKRLYINAFVTMPQYCLDSVSEKYVDDSTTMVELVLGIIRDPEAAMALLSGAS